jgi:hypothetical protein
MAAPYSQTSLNAQAVLSMRLAFTQLFDQKNKLNVWQSSMVSM